MLPEAAELLNIKLYNASLDDARPKLPFKSSLYFGFVCPIPKTPPNSAIPIVPPTDARKKGTPEISFTDQIYPVVKFGLIENSCP